jgi:capsular polysaccharide export protein
VILCPLQVETDTQIVLHSPQIRTMQELVDAVTAGVAEFNRTAPRKACVLFKIHPMEARQPRIDGDAAFLINESNVPEILARRCDLVVTINSTAGIEAIEHNKPVITLGNAFYSFPGVVHSHCAEPAQLASHIAGGLMSPAIDRGLQLRFIHALRTKYQARLRGSHAQPVAPPVLITPNVLESSPVGV